MPYREWPVASIVTPNVIATIRLVPLCHGARIQHTNKMKIRRPPLAVSISQRSYMDLVLIHKARVMVSQYRFCYLSRQQVSHQSMWYIVLTHLNQEESSENISISICPISLD